MVKGKLILGIFLAIFGIGALTFIFVKPIKAQESTSTTFPVNEAGIAAYLQVKDITPEKLSKVPFEKIEKQGKSYLIGIMRISPSPEGLGVTYPHIYIGMDGWIVAYYLRNEKMAEIVQFYTSNYHPVVSGTVLETAIRVVCQNAQLDCSLNEIKYYDFEFPEANKMTIIANCLSGFRCGRPTFLISVPGKVYEASYKISTTGHQLSLSLNGKKILEMEKCNSSTSYFSGDFDPNEFQSGEGSPGNVISAQFSSSCHQYPSSIIGIVLVYK